MSMSERSKDERSNPSSAESLSVNCAGSNREEKDDSSAPASMEKASASAFSSTVKRFSSASPFSSCWPKGVPVNTFTVGSASCCFTISLSAA